MNVSGKARRRRENFRILTFKIINFIKKIDQNRVQIPQNFSAPRGGGGGLLGFVIQVAQPYRG